MSSPTLPCSVSVYLGFDVAALRSRSWYSLLHPQDLSHASSQHRSLCKQRVLSEQPTSTKHVGHTPTQLHMHRTHWHNYMMMMMMMINSSRTHRLIPTGVVVCSSHSERGRGRQSRDGGTPAGREPGLGLALHGATTGDWRCPNQQQQLHDQVL